MKKSRDGFDLEDEYGRFRRRQRTHRMRLVGYAVSAALILIGMLIFCRCLRHHQSCVVLARRAEVAKL